MERGENAHYNSQTNEIVFNEIIIADKGVDPNEAIHSTLIHEVQHAIQSIEGFEVGGGTDMFTKAKDNIRRLFKDIDGVFDKLS